MRFHGLLEVCFCVFKLPIILTIQVDSGHFDALIGGCAFVLPVQGERCATGRPSLAVPCTPQPHSSMLQGPHD